MRVEDFDTRILKLLGLLVHFPVSPGNFLKGPMLITGFLHPYLVPLDVGNTINLHFVEFLFVNTSRAQRLVEFEKLDIAFLPEKAYKSELALIIKILHIRRRCRVLPVLKTHLNCLLVCRDHGNTIWNF